MTGMGSNDSKRQLIEALKQFMMKEKLESASYEYTLKRIQDLVDLPCFLINEAYIELHPTIYDELQVELAKAILRNLTKYYDTDLDRVKLINSEFGLSKAVVSEALKRLEDR